MIKKSILTKDNLIKRSWTVNEECHFCGINESVDHIMFHCNLAKFVWQVVVCAFDLTRPPNAVTDMLGCWLHSLS